MKHPVLLLVLDGVGDETHPELNNLTPLQSAHLPTFDHFAKTGQCGLIDPLDPGIPASTSEGTLAILGYDPKIYQIGRGVMEAFGADIPLQSGDIALRGNFACLDDNLKVKDRRAGRIREGVQELINTLNTISPEAGVKVIVKEATEHRIALVLRGKGLSDQIIGSDPTDNNPQGNRITPYAIHGNDAQAQRTALLLDQFEMKAIEVLKKHPTNLERSKKGLLPANGILTRSPGVIKDIPPFYNGKNSITGICIGAEKTVLGLAKMAKLDICSTMKMTANLDTDLAEKFDKALQSLKQYNFVMIHIKGCDIAAHDLKPIVKKEFLEKIDQALANFIKNWGDAPLTFGVISDHCTSSSKGYHIGDPVPVIINKPQSIPDSVQGYDEYKVARGDLGRFEGAQYLSKLLYGL